LIEEGLSLYSVILISVTLIYLNLPTPSDESSITSKYAALKGYFVRDGGGTGLFFLVAALRMVQFTALSSVSKGVGS